MMSRTLTIKNVFGIVILSVLSALVVGAIIAAVGLKYLPESNSQIANFLALFIGQAFMIIPLLLFLTARREPIIERLRIRSISLHTTMTAVVFSIGIIILVDEFDRLASMLFSPPEYLDQLGEMLKFNSVGVAIFLIFGIAVLAPLGEELLFRGFLQKFLEEHWQDVTRAVLVTSLFFAVIHMNPFWLIQIYILGVLLGFLAWKTGSIWAGFILHAANNLMALLFTNFDDSISAVYTWHGHVAPWIIVFGIICIYYGFTQLNKSAVLDT